MSRPIFILLALEELIDAVVELMDSDSDTERRDPVKRAARERVHRALDQIRDGR